MMWALLRNAAVVRYSLWNTMFEDGDPEKMKGHLAAIKALYGW
jgi:hypothetical protein